MTLKYLNAADLDQAAEDLCAPWRNDAACAGLGALMDPPADARTEQTIQLAKAVCGHCPVLADCANWVLALPPAADPGGVCAGLTETERSARRGMAGHKRCSRCTEIKPLEDFYRDRRTSDGRHANCKTCNNHLSLTNYHRKAARD